MLILLGILSDMQSVSLSIYSTEKSLSTIFNMSVYKNFKEFCSSNSLETRANQCNTVCKQIFWNVCQMKTAACIVLLPTCLLPISWEDSIANKLWNRPKYDNFTTRTAGFKNLLITIEGSLNSCDDFTNIFMLFWTSKPFKMSPIVHFLLLITQPLGCW